MSSWSPRSSQKVLQRQARVLSRVVSSHSELDLPTTVAEHPSRCLCGLTSPRCLFPSRGRNQLKARGGHGGMGWLMGLLQWPVCGLPNTAPVQKEQFVSCLVFLFEFPHSRCCLVSPVPLLLNVLCLCGFVWVCIGVGLNPTVHRPS